MKNPVDPVKITHFENMRLPLTLQSAIKEANRCLLCHDAPCSSGCPAGTDPGKFIRQMKFYNYKGAARTIRNNNILGNVCAHICPVEKLCEKACSIKVLEDPINIAGLQRFAIEYARSNGLESMDKSEKISGKIAVIGGGPAGISCASTLAKMDYDVTICERSEAVGGVPRWNIPEFRLPVEALKSDLESLINQGVNIRFNTSITTEGAALKLLDEGYEAVFISTGLTHAFTLDVLEGYTNTMDYITFLSEVKLQHHSMDLKRKNVAVIGGGSVALDSAISARACGAEKVYLISLEHLDELPADNEEINLAHIMHIIFKSGSKLTGVTAANGKILQLHGVEVEWIRTGNFSPENVQALAGTEFSILTDLIIQAIGTQPGLEVGQLATGLQTHGKGIITVNARFETNIPGIFAGGDVVNGGSTVVQAVGEGKKAALSIHNYIRKRRN